MLQGRPQARSSWPIQTETSVCARTHVHTHFLDCYFLKYYWVFFSFQFLKFFFIGGDGGFCGLFCFVFCSFVGCFQVVFPVLLCLLV